MPSAPLRVAVIGGGWAGLAAAVHATRQGHHATVYEMAPQLGGRARRVDVDGLALDNGQHILIGAYSQTLALMRHVGVDVDAAFLRTPLRVTYPEGTGLQLPPGNPVVAFLRAVASYPGWDWRDKLTLLATATRWGANGFRCDATLTVDALTAHLSFKVRDELLDPLCVAALNTPAAQASASVFLRVLKDALFAGPGSADLLLPRQRLSALWPEPAAHWLSGHGASIHLTQRVQSVSRQGSGWQVDGEPADAVVLACTATEAARLAEPHNAEWAQQARTLSHEPIVTVYVQSPGTHLPAPMMALHADPESPAQFVFDLGALGSKPGMLAFVVSGASEWIARGVDAVTAAVLTQAHQALRHQLAAPLVVLRTLTEKRATFLCTPGLRRPGAEITPGLSVAGDYVDGPYPATLEGAVRSGMAAFDLLTKN